MSAPVNVLAVLDRACATLNDEGLFNPGDDLCKASAAVAELIEAAKRANGDHAAPHDCYATGPLTGDPIRDLVACPGCELAAALARVTGEKA